jgi:hypothetical protein
VSDELARRFPFVIIGARVGEADGPVDQGVRSRLSSA